MHDPLLRSKRLTPRLAPIKFSISFLDELLVNFPINNRKTFFFFFYKKHFCEHSVSVRSSSGGWVL